MNAADYRANFQGAIADFQKKGEEKNKRLEEYAASLKPDNEKMFPRHLQMYRDMASMLSENLNYYASTPSTQAEFEQALNQMLGFKAQAESYYSVNFGDPKDNPGAATWLGQAKATQTGNPYAKSGYKDENSWDHYTEEFSKLSTPSYKTKIILNGGSFSTIDGTLDDLTQSELSGSPFQPSLVEKVEEKKVEAVPVAAEPEPETSTAPEEDVLMDAFDPED
jgi:hypothetical protein